MPEITDNKDSATIPEVISQNDLMTLNDRVARFNDELRGILGKYELALTAEAFVQNGQVLAAPKVIDNRAKPEAVEEAVK